MFGEDAYRLFVEQRASLRGVYRRALTLPGGTERTTLLRCAAVLVVAEFEYLLRQLIQARIDAVSDSYDSLQPGQKRLVARQTLAALRRAMDAIDEVNSVEDAERFVAALRKMAAWIDVPGAFARETSLSVGDIHKVEPAPKGLETTLAHFRLDGVRLFDWIEQAGHDQSTYRVTFQQMMELRNDVAHGLHQMPDPTDAEVRGYIIRTSLMARLVLGYLRE